MNYIRWASATRRLSLVLLGALLLYLVVHHIRQGQDVWFRLLVSCVPLIGFFPGLIKARFRTGSWLCFVLLLYFTGFTLALGRPGNQAGDALAMFLTVTLFISALMFARWQQRADLAQGESTS